MRIPYYVLAVACSALASALGASVGIPPVDRHIAKSEDIVAGTFEIGDRGNIYFFVEETLKGDVVVASKMLVNEDSRLAWRLLLGGGLEQPTKEAFRANIRNKEWFDEDVVLLGRFEDGLWMSSFYDWSVWPHGEKRFQGRTVRDVKKRIRAQLGDETDV